jgi:dihydrofolate reductase
MFNTQRKPRFGFNTLGNVIPVPSTTRRNVTIIAAMDAHNGIGKNNDMPWVISPDMQQFKRLTTDHTVVYGRKTFKSMGSKPLPDRLNVVLTSDLTSFYRNIVTYPDLVGMCDLKNAIEAIGDEQIFIIGGGHIYESALMSGLVNDMILTRLSHNAQCDVKFPDFNRGNWLPPTFSTHQLAGKISMRYEYWRRIQTEPFP